MAAFRELVLEGGDRQAVIDILVQQGGMSPEEAERTLQNLEAEYQQAGQAAQAAAETISSAALWSFIALLLGAIAAAVGGWIGAPRDEIVAEAVVR